MAFIYDLSDTWNNAGTSFNGIKLNATDTASAAGSKLLDLQINGAPKFTVGKTGTLTATGLIESTVGGFKFPDGTTQTTKATVNSVSGTGTVNGLTLTGTVTNSGSLTLGGTLVLTSGQVTTALGYSPVQSIASTDGSVTVTGTTAINLSVATAGATSNVLLPVRNTTGATLTKGTAVYISGATGQISTVTKAIANTDATSAQTLGLVTADIANNANGNVTLIGTITNIDTSAYTDGQQLYLSPTTAGTLTATKPYAPQHLVYMAVVEHAHPSLGKLFVKVQNGYEMDELHDVSAQTPSNGQTLVYNSTTGLWQNNTVSLTAGVNGTLPAANGGTGTATSFTAGSVVFAGASGVYTQKNSNFFWDNTNDRLGIGTTSPSATLDVNGNIVLPNSGIVNFKDAGGVNRNVLQFISGEVRLGGAGAGLSTQTFYTAAAERMRIPANGDVLVNTTTSLYGYANNPSIELNGVDGSTIGLKKGNVAGSYISHSTNLNIFNTTANGIVLGANNTERMRITAGGDVGIGTSSPKLRLQVTSAAPADTPTLGVASGTAYFTNNNDAYGLLTGLRANGDAWLQVQRTDAAATAYNILLNPSGGNVGIGTATPRAVANHTNIGINGTSGSFIDFFTGGTRYGTIFSTSAEFNVGTPFSTPLTLTTNATERMRVTATGLVGIGTSAPATLLHISATNPEFRLQGTNGTGNIHKIRSTGLNSESLQITSATDTYYNANLQVFRAANEATEYMRITSAGNVGIGTTTPAQKLSVAGTIESTTNGVIVPDQLAYDYATSNLPTTRPALSLDFADVGALDPRVTFTRATTATFVGSNGLIQTAAINAPRFDYDPVTLAAKGLLIEEARTNLFTYSDQFDNAAWTKNTGGAASIPTVTPNFATAPDGTTTADRVQIALNGGTTTGDFANVAQPAAYPSGSVTLTIWMRSNTGSNQTVLLVSGNAQAADSLKTVTPTWQRFSTTQTLTAGSSGAGVRLRGTFTGDTADILVWGAQLEAGAFATSYIPTVASTVTRSADVATMTGTNFSSWYRQDEGTMVFEGSSVGPSTLAQTLNALTASDGTNNNVHRIGRYLDFWFGETRDGNVQQTNPSAAGSYTQNATAKVAYAYKTNDFALSANGATALTDTSGTVPTVVNLLRIGGPPIELNGHIRSITYYNTRLPNAVLQGITS